MMSTPFDPLKIRRDFPILNKPLSKDRKLVFLDSGASAQKPQCVIDKESEVYERYYANAYRGVYEFGNHVDTELEKTRALVQQWIGAASPEEIIFTAGTTMSLNMVARAWGGKFLTAGDEILLNPLEHHANLVPWQIIAREKGAIVKYIPLTPSCELDLTQIEQVVSAKTRLISVTGMSNVTGTKPPLEILSQIAKSVGAIFVVDAAQTAPHQKIDVQALGIDFLAFSGHKVFGPSGVGCLYGRTELLLAMDPFMGGGHMIDRVYLDHSTWALPPAKFEAGTLPIAQAIALGTALEYLGQQDLNAVHKHEVDLTQYAFDRLQSIPGLKIYGPPAAVRGPIVSFTIDKAHPEDLAQLLNRYGVFVRHGHHCTMPLHDLLGVSSTVRASFALYNTREEIDILHDSLIASLKKLRVI
jgi:cysteine desulfurase/selenocysteine lyase